MLSVSPTSISEGGGEQQVIVTATLGSSGDQVRPRAIQVTLLFGGSAVETDDFTVSGTRLVTIPMNQRSGSTTLTFTPVDDLLLEMDETITVDGTTAGLSVVGADPPLTLTDNDALPQVILEVSDDTIREDETSATAVSVTARLHPSVMVTADVVVTLSLGGSATEGTTGDYTASWLPVSRQLTIPSGTSTSGSPVTLTLTPRQDPRAEGDESIVVEGTAKVSNPEMDPLAVVVARITLVDDDVPAVTVSPTTLEIVEGNSANYTVVLESEPSGSVTVGMTALLAGTDVTVEPRSLTFTSSDWSVPQTVAVTAASDDDVVGDDPVTLTHTVRGGGYDGVAVDDVLVTILESGTLPLTLSVSPYAIDEDGDVSTVTVSTTGTGTTVSDETIALSFTGTATKGVDYEVGAETLVLPAGQSSVTTTVTGLPDEVREATEAVVVTASHDGRVVGTEVIALTDNVPPVVTLALSPGSVNERGGVSIVTATLSHEASEEVTLTVAAEAVSPAMAGDFELSANRVLTIAAGSTESTGGVTLTAVHDGVNGPNKRVTVSATAAGGRGVEHPDPVTLTIVDHDPTPRVTFVLTPSAVSENGGETRVSAILDTPVVETVEIGVAVSPVSPAVSGDFEFGGGTLVIRAREKTSNSILIIRAVDNDVDAPDKTLTVFPNFFTGGPWAGRPDSVELTIEDDDEPPTVTLVLSPSRIGEAEGVSTVTATLSHPMTTWVRLDVSAEAVAPALARNFDLSENTELLIRRGRTTSERTVTITSVNNNNDEPEKEVTVSATVLVGAVSPPAPQTLTIEDNDPTPELRLSLDRTSIGENGGVTTVKALIGQPSWVRSSEAIELTVSAAAVSPAVAGDFALSDDRVLTIPAHKRFSEGTVTITAVDNDVDAPDKTLTVSASVSGGNGVSAPDPRTVTITDDDDLPAATLVLTPASIGENGGVSAVTATLDHPSSEAVELTVSAAAESPAVAGDFELSDDRVLTIAPGETTSTGTVTITSVNNDVFAPDKEVTVSATVSGGGGVSAPSSVTLTIEDDEAAPVVTLVLTPASVSEDGGESTVTASLSRASSASVELTVSAAAESPAMSGDFELSTSKVLTIAAGETTSTGTVTITAVDNDVFGPDREVTVSATVSEDSELSAPSSVTLTIEDDEAAPVVTLVLNPASVSEDGGESTVTASLSGASSASVELTVSAAAESPAVSGDFELSTSRVLTIAAGETTSTGTVTITAVDNDVFGPDKEVTVSATVSEDSGLSAPSEVTLTIEDDEAAPVVTLVLNPASVSEDGGESTVTASLSGASSASVELTVSAAAESPAVSGDFELSTSKVLTIAAGETTSTGTVTITAVDNDVDAPDKTVKVSAAATGGNGVSAPASRTLTITDDDELPTVTLVLNPASIGENGGVSTVTATLDHGSSESVEVTVSAAAESPAVSGDFELSANEALTIAAGETTSTGTVTIRAVNNDVDAPDKEVTVSATVSGGRGVSAPSSATLTIEDDEDAPTVTLVLSPASIGEDGGVSTVTASLTGTSSASVEVTVSAAAESPAVPGDFELSANKVLTIAAGETASTGTVTITAVDNDVDAPNKTVTVSATVTGGRGVSAPGSQTLTITDDEGAPTVTLALSPASIGEDGGVSTVTASLTGTSSASVELTVSAAAESPAVSGDFELSANKVLTIAAGETTSTGAVTITAVDNDVDAPDKKVTVSATASGGEVSAPSPATLTIEDDEDAPVVTLALSPGVDRGGRRREHGDGEPERGVERVGGGDGVRGGGVSGGAGRLRAEREQGADDRGGRDDEHRGGDDHGGGQRRGRAGQDGEGFGIGDRWQRGVGAVVGDADDRGRRDDAGGDAGAESGVDRGERRREHGDGEPERGVERVGGGDGVCGGGVSGGVRRLHAEREQGADDSAGFDDEHRSGDDHGGEQRRGRAGTRR